MMHLSPVISPVSITPFLSCSEVINCTNAEIRSLARSLTTSDNDDPGRARSLYLWVRDKVAHSGDSGYHEIMWKAVDVLKSGHGLCFGKSHLLVALCRSLGIPAGLCYQRVKVGDQKWVLHGFTAVYLEQPGRWIRLDPRGNTSEIMADFSVDEDKITYYPQSNGEWLDQHVYPEPWQDLIRIVEMSADVEQLIALSQEIRNPPVRHDRSLPDKSLICST